MVEMYREATSVQLISLLPEIYYIRRMMGLLCYILRLGGEIKETTMMRVEIVRVSRVLRNNSRIRDGIIRVLLVRAAIYLCQRISVILEELEYVYEYIILILNSVLGMVLLIKANDLRRMYLAIELQSMGMYILAAYNRDSYRREAGLKYYIMGGFASCIQLLGIGLIYGLTGTTNYRDLSLLLRENEGLNTSVWTRVVFIRSGLLFKLGAAPFHMWLPDVYEGAPFLSTAFFRILPKLSLLCRTWKVLEVFNRNKELIIIVCRSILIGTIQRLSQKYIKRLLRYSRIRHVGFILMGLVRGAERRSKFYLIIYIWMSIRMFRIIGELKSTCFSGKNNNELKRMLNLKCAPRLRLTVRIILFSMAGIPPLRGFFSKYYILERTLYRNLLFVRLVGILGSIIATVYYIQIIQIIFFVVKNKKDKLRGYVLKRSYITSVIIRLRGILRVGLLRVEDVIYIII